MASERVLIAEKFCGPPRSGNGGYSAGVVATWIDGPCAVTLRAPPPLDRPLALSRSEDGIVSMRDGETLVAEARAGAFELALPEPVSLEQAELATLSYPGSHPHPYPRCFVCGPERSRGDGLAIYPGPVGTRTVVASPWSPTPDLCSDGRQVDAQFVWAALDCPSWFGFSMFEDDVPATLLGRLAVDVRRRPERDEPCVVVGWSTGREGRKVECGSMLLDVGGACLAFAKSTWVTLKQPVA